MIAEQRPSPAKGEKNTKATKKLTREDEQQWKELLIASSTGNTLAYEDLLRQISKYLQYFCGKYLHNDSQAEDCVQECLLAIHKAKHTFNPSKPFGPWFFTIVRHKIIDQYRKNKRLSTHEIQDPDYLEFSATASASIDMSIDLEKLLSQISASYVAAFRLCKLEGKSIQQAASELNIGESAVKQRVRRATKALKKLIKEEFAVKYE